MTRCQKYVRQLTGRVLLSISLILCVIISITWARSYLTSDEYTWLRSGQGQNLGSLVKFCSASGGLDFELHRFRMDAPAVPMRQIFELQGTAGTSWTHRKPWGHRAGFFDFFWIIDRGVRNEPHLVEEKLFVACPHWVVFVVTLIAPALVAIRLFFRSYNVDRCVCAKCGYDLRATPGRCPECGTIPGRSEAI